MESKPVSTPLDVSLILQQQDGTPNIYAIEYIRLIDRLIYLITTRLDITFAVQQLSQYMTSLSQTHHQTTLKSP